MSNNNKKTGSYYTSTKLSKYMARELLKNMDKSSLSKETIKVLDPSCGEGELLNAIETEFQNISTDLIGIDINPDVLVNAKEYLSSTSNSKMTALEADYIELVKKLIHKGESYDEQTRLISDVDAIIANPPYVRTQNMDKDRLNDWKKYFGLSGRVDLYHIFLAAMTQNLKVGAYMCAITSNKYLNTTGGKSVRKLLFENYEIIEIIDLGDTKLFDAAVLPAIFIGRKKNIHKNQNKNPTFTKIYEIENIGVIQENKHISSFQRTDNFFEILDKNESGFFIDNETNKKFQVKEGVIDIPENYSDNWVLATKEELKWAKALEEKSYAKFDDLFQVKVGIKTTADKVFIKKDWSSLPTNIQPEPELIRPLITSKSIKNWKIDSAKNLKILYPYTTKNGKRIVANFNKFPKSFSYLKTHEERLKSRKYLTNANREWFEIWVTHNPDDWEKLKIVFPDISVSPQFSIDKKGFLVDGNCYWIIPKNNNNDDWLYLAAGVANSSTMDKYHTIKFQNTLYSDRKRYITQYVKEYLIPDIKNQNSQKIISIMKKITDNNFDDEILSEYQLSIDKLVEKAFFGL